MASDIVITPNRGSTTVNAKIDFTGASTASSQIRLEVLPDNSLAFVGTTGSLFSIADSVTGSLMSVNDASGLPILEVFDTDKVVMGQYNQNTLVVNGTQVGIGTGSPTNKLTIAGVNSNGITLTGSNATITASGTTPNLILSAGTNIYARPGSGYDLIVDTGNGINVTTGNIRAPAFYYSSDTNSRWVNGYQLYLRGTSPTIWFRDTDQNSAMIHVNSNIFYILRGANDTETWTQVNSRWPMEIDLTNNNMAIGGNLNVAAGTGTVTAATFSGALSGNATTATTLQTARNLTINGTSKSFNGSADISWTATEIGLTSYLPLTGGTISSNLTITGNLTVNGTTTTVNSTTTTLDDPIITLGGDTAPGSDDNKDRGVEFRWHNGTAAKVGFFGYDDSTGYFTFIPDATNTSEVFSGTQGDIQASNFRGNLIGNVTGNATTATTLQTARNIAGVSFNGSADITLTGQNISTSSGTAANDIEVAKYLRWKNYGNNHILIDASQGTNPGGGAIDRYTPGNTINSTGAGSNTWGEAISLMGWNGSATYGVRVDRARSIDNQANSATITATSANTASQIVQRDGSGNFSAQLISANTGVNANTSAPILFGCTNAAAGTTGLSSIYQSTSSGLVITTKAGSAYGMFWTGPAGQSLFNLSTGGTLTINDTGYTTNFGGPVTVSGNTVLNAGNYTSYVGNGTLTLNTSGNGISGSTSFTANQSGAGTFTVTSNATAANTASTIVFRDGSGNFAAGQITGTSFLKNSITVPGMFVQAGSTGAPSAIQNGDLWWNTETGKLKIWYSTSSAWVDATSVPDLANYFPVAGGNITGNVSIGGLLNTTGNMTARNGQTHSLSMGHHPSYGTSWAGVWRTGSDYALITNSSDTLINAPTGSIGFRVANSQYASVANDGVHTSYWFRNDANNTGLYNTTTFLHLSSTGANTSYLDISTVGSTNSGIRFYTGGHVNTLRGYIVANTSNELMLWNAGGSYSARFTSSVSEIYQDTYVPTLYANIMYRRGDTGYYLDPAATESGKMKYSFTVSGAGSSAGYGLALYPSYTNSNGSGTEPTYGVMFASTSTYSGHGAVASGDWATYFTMSNTDARGWIFRKAGSGNVASISGSGRMRVQSLGVNSDPSATAGTIVTSGAITAGSFVKSGGASNELLKADGFVELETNYVKTAGTQTVGGLKTFSSQVNLSDSLFFDNFGLITGIYFRSSNTNRLVIWYSNNTAVIGAGTGVDVTIGATNPIRIKSATGAIECASSVTATSFIKSSGTSSQFLKADGSVDSSTYLTTAVTSLTGTANQVTVSASTGSVTLSLPQSINTGASIQFGSLGVGTAASGTTGEIRATNNITAYYSDDRLKTKLGVIDNPIEKVKSLSGFYFEANETAVALGYQKKREVGVSAQEVQAILPEIIAPAPIDEQYMTVRYEKLIPLLIEAIKAQQSQIEELQKLIKEKA